MIQSWTLAQTKPPPVRVWQAVLIWLVVGCLANPPIGRTSPVIRIMPLGDSITDGFTVPGGYRTRLHQNLTAAGYQFDFVGSSTNNGDPALPDPDHEGHSGFRIDNIHTYLASGGKPAVEPDVILLLIGTNDFFQGYDTGNAIRRLDTLISLITSTRPNVRLIVANVLIFVMPTYNPLVPGLVEKHRDAGEHTFFVDLKRALSPGDLYDGVHPDLNGHNKLADAWFAAITAVIPPPSDVTAPLQILRANAAAGGTNVTVTFTKPLAESAANPALFAIDGGLEVLGATIAANDICEITLATSPQTPGVPYTITVNGVRDRTEHSILIATNSLARFRGAVASGVFRNVPEASNYGLVYSLNLPDSAAFNSTPVPYSVDNRALTPPFKRIAYYLELESYGQKEFVYLSMDAFTTNVNHIGVPAAGTGAFFQQNLTNFNVASSVPEILTGTNLTGGNIEFWPEAYFAANGANVPNARDSVYDFGDAPAPGNYGSMQIHNHAAKQVLLAYNRWGAGAGFSDLGIGNNIGNPFPDWTFMGNAVAYTAKTLQVLVLPEAAWLMYRRNEGRVTLAWPAGTSGVILQHTGELKHSSSVWLPVTNAVTHGDGVFEVLVDTGSDGRFFRLVNSENIPEARP